MTLEETCDAVRDFLDENELRYEYHADRQCLTMGFSLDCKLKSLNMFIQFRDDGFLLYGICPINADPNNLGEVLKYTSMINYGLVPGNFEVDIRDGEIRSKTWTRTLEAKELDGETINACLALTFTLFEQFGNGFAALAMGFSDAETEYKKVVGAWEDNEEEDSEPT